MKSDYRIGDLARATDTAVETVRYYERIGLLPEPPRTEGNYRLYGEAHLHRLRFIQAYFVVLVIRFRIKFAINRPVVFIQ